MPSLTRKVYRKASRTRTADKACVRGTPPLPLMAKPDVTPVEQAAFAHMQARLIELLLRHHERSFRRLYGQHADYAQETNPDLQRYRDLAVLFHLRDELFEHILPRIVRRLSFESPRTVLREEPPAQGRVDWDRTLDATWAERPGEPPLLLHTRQRRREFLTPENLLTVVTLLQYREDVQRLLSDEHTVIGNEALRHPLNEIVERCERELAFPQFAGLRQTAQSTIEGIGGDPEILEAQVHDRLLPGSNSAYEELLDWRTRYHMLTLLDRRQGKQSDYVLGADPNRDNYLYQLWLFYELSQILQQQGAIIDWDDAQMRFSYTWGVGDEQCTYTIQHDQSIKYQGVPWLPWQNAPGVRPDLYIRRSDAQVVCGQDERIYWREPGYVLDAKYYKPRESIKAPGNPVKRMLADLQLTDERRGALVFAFQRTARDATARTPDDILEPDVSNADPAAAPLYEVIPTITTTQHTQPDVRVGVWRVQPTLSGDVASLHSVLTGLVEHVHQVLKGRIEIGCHGVFLDTLTATGQGTLASTANLFWRDGTKVDTALEEILICPKPHVGPWRVDVVSLSRDCCQNGEVCHIIGRPDARKPKRLTALDEIADAIQAAAGSADDESLNAAATEQVLVITKRYAQLLQPQIEEYRGWIRDTLDVGELFETTPLLSDSQRETLALARFLWEQIDHIRATNYAGPTLLFTGVLEELTRASIYRQSGILYTSDGKPLPDTLGTLGNSLKYGGTNFSILENVVVHRGSWNTQITEDQTLLFPVGVNNPE